MSCSHYWHALHTEKHHLPLIVCWTAAAMAAAQRLQQHRQHHPLTYMHDLGKQVNAYRLRCCSATQPAKPALARSFPPFSRCSRCCSLLLPVDLHDQNLPPSAVEDANRLVHAHVTTFQLEAPGNSRDEKPVSEARAGIVFMPAGCGTTRCQITVSIGLLKLKQRHKASSMLCLSAIATRR